MSSKLTGLRLFFLLSVLMTFFFTSPGFAAPPYGELDTPIGGQTISGTFYCAGWAKDDNGIKSVKYQFNNVDYNAYYGTYRADLGGYYGYNFEINTTLYSNGTYNLKVVAYGYGGSMDYKEIKSINVSINNSSPPPIPILSYPQNGWILSDTTPDLTVNSANGVNHVHFQISTDSNFISIVSQNENVQGWTYTPVQGLPSNITYYWRARFFGPTGVTGDWSLAWSFTVQAMPAPSNLIALANGSSVNLTWQDNSSNEDGFYIYRKMQGEIDFNYIGNTGSNAVSYQDFSVSPNNIYYYKVKAHNYNDDSAFSNEYYAYVLGAPSNLTASWSGTSQINLSWSDNSNQEIGFKVERRDGSGSWTEIGYKSANQTSYSDTAVTYGASYSYRLRAYYDSTTLTPHYFGYSNEINVAGISITPPTKVSVTYESANSRNLITWSPVPGAVGYKLYWGTAPTTP